MEARSIRGTLSRRSSAHERKALDPRGPGNSEPSRTRLRRRSVVHLLILAIILAAVSYSAFPPGHLSIGVAKLSNPAAGLSLSGVAAAVRPEVEPPSPVEPQVVEEAPPVYPTPVPVPEETLEPAEVTPPELQPVAVPRPQPEPEAEPVETPPAEPFFVYTVVEGDTASALAARYGIKPESIAWNNADVQDEDFLAVGQQIRIPTADGIIHEVSFGQTLTDIALVYDADIEQIVSFPANEFPSADVILEDQMVFVPNGVMPTPPEPEPVIEESPVVVEEAPALVATEEPEADNAAPQILEAPASDAGLIWPVTGPISSYFGPGHPLGIDIDLYNSPGAAIAAAAGGTVILAGGDPCCSYGLQVLIEHPNGMQTRYAHLGNILVSVGQAVDQGQILGSGGCTGYCTGNHLHFEVIVDGYVVNPLAYLP